MELDNAEKWKHEQIYEHVHAAILRGEYGPGDRVPTDMQLMRKFKTSRPTVARAMRDLEAAGLLQRRRGAPSVVKGAPKLQTRPLGLLVPSLDKMGIFGPLGAEITRLAHVDGFHLVWFDTAGPSEADAAESMRQFCRHCVVQKFAGVFFAPAELMPGMEAVNCQAAETLDEAGIALVLLDRDLTAFPERSRFDVVGVDNFRVGFMQTDHLLERGCRHIEHVARPLSAPTVDARTEGYRCALRRHGLSCRESWVRRGDPADKEFLKELTSRLPEAFVCANDWTAARLLQGLQGLGIRVPQDVRLVGVDDDTYAHLLSTPLTTVRQPSREIGAAAVRAMIERIEDRSLPPRDILLGCTLVIRESSGGK